MNVIPLIGFLTTVMVYWVAARNLNSARVGSKAYGRKWTVLALWLIMVAIDHAHPWKPVLEPSSWRAIEVAALVAVLTTGDLYVGSRDHPQEEEQPA